MFKRLVVIGLVVSAAALSGCGTNGAAGGAGASSEVAAARLTAHPALAALEIALADPGVALRAEQRPSVEAIRAELSAALAPVRAARAALAERFAASLESGAFDGAGVDAAASTLELAETAAVPAVVKASDALHGALDAAQRKALVATMRDQGKGSLGAFGGGRARLKQLADDLALTDDQRDQFKAAIRAQHDGARDAAGTAGSTRDRMRAQADAFVADRYDAASAGVGEQMARGSARYVARTRALIELAVKVLTPAQRAQLAGKIRATSAD